MTERNRRQQENDRNQNVSTNAPRVGDFDSDPTDDDMWSEEELERARMGWRADDEQEQQNVPNNASPVSDLEADVDELEAADALTDMAAHEMRRDQYHSTGGDDHNPGFDSDIDANGPKADDLGTKKRAGSRGKSDWR